MRRQILTHTVIANIVIYAVQKKILAKVLAKIRSVKLMS